MQKCRVLIVDDDAEVREALHDELRASYDVEVATGGREALMFIGKKRYDAVVSDLRMPDLDGIAVLQAAEQRDPETVRILLTGYIDEVAHQAVMREGAPFKVGKPWHDEIEVTLRRGFEQRATRRSLKDSFGEALELSGVDDELASAEGLVGLAQVVIERLSRLHGISSAAVRVDDPGSGIEQLLAGYTDPTTNDLPPAIHNSAFRIDEPFTSDGAARANVAGFGERPAAIARVLLARARRWTSEDPMTRLSRMVSVDPDAQTRLLALARRASMGMMAASLYHELASVLHILLYSVEELGPYVERAAPPQHIREALSDSVIAARRGMALFSAMRLFVHDGQQTYRRWSLAELVQQSVTLAAPHQRGRCHILVEMRDSDGNVTDQPTLASLDGSGPLLVQVFVNLLRNAVEASPPDSEIKIVVTTNTVGAAEAEVCITDQGPGVPVEHRGRLFEPFFTTKGAAQGTGLGLAFAKKVVLDHGGTMAYEARRDCGATFVVRLPVSVSDTNPKR